MQHGVDHDGAVVGAGEQGGALGEQRQDGRAEVAVQRQRHFCGAECHLEEERSECLFYARYGVVITIQFDAISYLPTLAAGKEQNGKIPQFRVQFLCSDQSNKITTISWNLGIAVGFNHRVL